MPGIFVWSATDMLDISSFVINHFLIVDFVEQLIRKKKIRFFPYRIRTMKEKKDKLLKVGYIKKV